MSDAWEAAAVRNDRERVDNARRAAEALFKPKQAAEQPQPAKPEPEAAPPSDAPSRRRPRILSAQPAPSSKPEVKAKAPSDPPRPRQIPESQVGQIRTLARYGMTRAQLAAHHEVPVEEIDRVLGRN
ncbi:MAG TPA: hypothetical protein VFA12_08120 [Stellaceae bacterium]|nr:hypothetical protein [Stellaceae bacterium]